jgi:hypothetical protein
MRLRLQLEAERERRRSQHPGNDKYCYHHSRFLQPRKPIATALCNRLNGLCDQNCNLVKCGSESSLDCDSFVMASGCFMGASIMIYCSPFIQFRRSPTDKGNQLSAGAGTTEF